jgi:integrase
LAPCEQQIFDGTIDGSKSGNLNMAHVANKLSSLQVLSLKPGKHADGGGLYLWVKDSGARSWFLRLMVDGKRRDLGLGPATGPNAVTLANARKGAREMRSKVLEGFDPVKERAIRKAGLQAKADARDTFRDVAEAHIARIETRFRNSKHRQQWRNTLATYAFPVIGDLPVQDITVDHIVQVLLPIWATKAETASRLRGRIENILDAARVLGLRKGDNPARWSGNLALILPARQKLTRGHHQAMPWGDVPAFIAQLRRRPSASALALEFCILTATRTIETVKAQWSEIDLGSRTWTIPAIRMKAGREHRVPLTDRAVAILNQLEPLGSVWCFPSNSKQSPLSNMAMLMLLQRMTPDLTVHGFRSSFSDWANESTDFASETIEMALAHSISNKVEAAYRRGDLFEKRVTLMKSWETYCNGQADG